MASAREQKLAQHGAGGDVSVADVECGLGLVDAAAARLGEDVADEQRDDDAGEGGDEDYADVMRGWRLALQQDGEPVDGHAEADDEQAGDDADEDGEQQQQALFAVGGDAGCGLHGWGVGIERFGGADW